MAQQIQKKLTKERYRNEHIARLDGQEKIDAMLATGDISSRIQGVRPVKHSRDRNGQRKVEVSY